jgi:hypothetical protein
MRWIDDGREATAMKPMNPTLMKALLPFLVLLGVAAASPAFSDDQHHHHDNDQNYWWQDDHNDRDNRNDRHDRDEWNNRYRNFWDQYHRDDHWNGDRSDDNRFPYPPSNSGDNVGGHGKNH